MGAVSLQTEEIIAVRAQSFSEVHGWTLASNISHGNTTAGMDYISAQSLVLLVLLVMLSLMVAGLRLRFVGALSAVCRRLNWKWRF